MEDRIDDNCADCGAERPAMHNSREVKGWLPFMVPVTKREPGYLCVECWKAANPVLYPGEYRKQVRKPSLIERAYYAPWAWVVLMFIVAVFCALLSIIILDYE